MARELQGHFQGQEELGATGFPVELLPPSLPVAAGRAHGWNGHPAAVMGRDGVLASTDPTFRPVHAAVSAAGCLADLRRTTAGCQKCRLCQTRRNVVFGEGAVDADLVFVGEGPGHDEDRLGRPFVGRSGQLLDRILIAMGLSRESVYICNIVKCRPPSNRNPRPDEIKSCEPYLLAQLNHLKPKVICALGTFAAQTLLGTRESISRLRGRLYRYHDIELMATFHPAYLLRKPLAKKQVWDDMQKIQEVLGIPPGSYVGKGPYLPPKGK